MSSPPLLALESLRGTLPVILACSTVPAKCFSELLNDAYTPHSPRPRVHPTRARIRRVELRKDRSGTRCEYLLAFVTLDGRPWTEAPLGVVKCERNVLSEDRDPMKPPPPPTARVAYWLYVASSLYTFLKNQPVVYNGDHLRLYSPNEALLPKYIRRSWTFYAHEYTTLPAAGPVDVTQPHLDFPHWSRDVTVPPTLFHLAAITSLLEQRQPEYIVPERQCLWYTSMLFYLLVGQDALVAEVEYDAKRVPIEDAYRPEPIQGTSIPTSNTVLHADSGTFRDLFERVTRKDIETIRTEEKLDAMACERRLADLYGGLRDTLLDDRDRFDRWGPFADPAKNAVIKALDGTLRDMEMEMLRAAAAEEREAERAAATKKLEAYRALVDKQIEEKEAAAAREMAAAAKAHEAEMAAAFKELEAMKATAAKEREAERAAAAQKIEAVWAATAQKLDAERAARGVEDGE